MSSSSDESAYSISDTTAASQKKYKGIRRRKWGKWVTEIRVPGTPERLWLGSYATPEAAAVAHDVAFYCLRGNSSPQSLNFPLNLPAGARIGMSPRSVQKAASDAGLATDARLLNSRNCETNNVNSSSEEQSIWRQSGSWRGGTSNWSRRSDDQEEYLNISVDDYL
ncbi:hypothetical protein BUALT_Bualt08G0146300 [Buddleja alternifolia]|uniref:AP2/ERF domain-containing protein n=1 Tax=Buddleja alternifolia TaxID=168488 RepID=A0AAV6XES2_9LAMI|nr:hypothetical protein BUALT_Bualt08G0146300 [Buddleja alternifolia]